MDHRAREDPRESRWNQIHGHVSGVNCALLTVSTDTPTLGFSSYLLPSAAATKYGERKMLVNRAHGQTTELLATKRRPSTRSTSLLTRTE
jgi:hypothetical protein